MLVEKEKCVGCGACAVKCPAKAIAMVKDMEGFYYPEICMDTCNDCRGCEKVCPVINIEKIEIAEHNQECYACFLKDEKLLRKTSSGGAATALAKAVIRCDGAVFGVAYAKDFKSAEFILCNTYSDLQRIRGTKYIQSRKRDIYKSIERQCIQGRMTLVIGLPCEIAAVKSFLGKEYENLYMCELICHGPTSEKVQKCFVELLEQKYRSGIEKYNVRFKKEGWTPFYIQAKFINGRIYENRLEWTDFFHALAIFIRPSCYHCEFRGDKRVADISIGDFWGEIKNEKFYNENGVSAIMIHTEKGKKLFGMANELISYPVNYEVIRKNNPRIDTCEKENVKRALFSKIFANRKLSEACLRTRGIRKSLTNLLQR